jgi:hypothetical protein
MKLNKDPFSMNMNMVELDGKKVLVHPSQAELTKGKEVLVQPSQAELTKGKEVIIGEEPTPRMIKP